MNKLRVKKLSVATILAEDVSAVFDKEHIESNSIDIINWEEYPYQPLVTFRIAHNGNNILLNYKVEEDDVRALSNKDNGEVWKDACVEFFVSFEKDPLYYNIETNCIGSILIGAGADRQQRQRLPVKTIENIQRWTSLGNSPIIEANALRKWEVSLIIPKEVFVWSNLESFSGIKAGANFYKCGDELKTPHFLSWNPIKNEIPNFHLPDFFGDIEFE